jgi:hypothetical protein
MLSKIHVKEGDKLYIIETPEGFRLMPYDEEFIRQIQLGREIIRKKRDVLRALVNG